jgi:hypothetical protein
MKARHRSDPGAKRTPRPRARPVFAHPIERELALLLDRCSLHWRYEPHTFVLARRRDGSVARAFTPDFYLPDLDYYLECTVARRPLTRGKRRKAEAARRLYGIHVEIVYRADLERLAARWSLGGLARALEACLASRATAPARGVTSGRSAFPPWRFRVPHRRPAAT